MLKLPSSLQKLIQEFSKLPGIGPRSAQRLAFYLLKKSKIDTDSLAAAVANVRTDVIYCTVCHTMAETDPCSVCSDPNRDHGIICVVEEPLDAIALDKTGEYKGVFHVLNGVLNPLEGVGPEQLNIESLMQRIAKEDDSLTAGGSNFPVREVIIATNPSLEGETTAMHLTKLIKEYNHQSGKNIRVSRIARGLPMGGDLEYADDITLTRALEGRSEF